MNSALAFTLSKINSGSESLLTYPFFLYSHLILPFFHQNKITFQEKSEYFIVKISP